MYVIVIFLIVPCIYSSYILVSIMEITKTEAFWFKSYPIEIHNGHTSLVVLLCIYFFFFFWRNIMYLIIKGKIDK